MTLVNALSEHDPQAPAPLTGAYLEDVRVAGLTLLYRLLFVLYAEDRNLLPVRDVRYDDYALRRIRESVRDRIDANDIFSRTQGRYHRDLKELSIAIHAGDESVGLPPYNGGLFDPTLHPVLNRVTIPDADFAGIVDALSRRLEGEQRKWINYRDLSVQQLGSIYEQFLEHEVTLDNEGRITIRPNVFARRASGSYYTHEDLVTLIIERAVGPLLKELIDTFEHKVACQSLIEAGFELSELIYESRIRVLCFSQSPHPRRIHALLSNQHSAGSRIPQRTQTL